jgi:hypothetical protein
MGEILAPADAEAVLIADLKAQYVAHSVSASVGTKIRDPRPTLFTKVILAGGGSSYVYNSPMLIVECWGPTEAQAWELAALTVALVESISERVGICSGYTHVGDPVNQPDPESGSPRYVFTKVLHLRKHAL